MYCGDETGSFVGQVGSHTSRFGYGGDESPRFVNGVLDAVARAIRAPHLNAGPDGEGRT